MPTLVADANCTNVDHRNDLNKLNDNITESMSKASEAIFDNNCAGTNRIVDDGKSGFPLFLRCIF